jgi:hypothetical protein
MSGGSQAKVQGNRHKHGAFGSGRTRDILVQNGVLLDHIVD